MQSIISPKIHTTNRGRKNDKWALKFTWFPITPRWLDYFDIYTIFIISIFPFSCSIIINTIMISYIISKICAPFDMIFMVRWHKNILHKLKLSSNAYIISFPNEYYFFLLFFFLPYIHLTECEQKREKMVITHQKVSLQNRKTHAFFRSESNNSTQIHTINAGEFQLYGIKCG